ncbi:MAG: DNA primase [Pirellula sp.]
MSHPIDNELKDRVRSAINIVDLVSRYLELRPQGRNFVARCPFHDDRKPSMQINPARQSWKCWVCDIGGDVFSFVMQKEGVTFPEALRMLADQAGIEIEPPRNAGKARAAAEEKRALYEVMAWAVEQYHTCLIESDEAAAARAYLSERGLSMDSVLGFKLGFSPDSWSWLIDRAGKASIKPDVLDAAGLLSQNERGQRYDRFRGRLLFPIQDPTGRPIAFGGRVLPGAPTNAAKYINCSETRLYQKNQTLYALDQARAAMSRSRQAIVMEGYTDVMMAFQYGITNAVACCGTALGENHITLLKRYCDSVVLLLDGDEAGQRRTTEILDLFLTANMDLRVLTLPDQLDPCDYLMRYGRESMEGLLAQSLDALEHKIRSLCQGFDPLLDTHRAVTAMEEILKSLAKIPQGNAATRNTNRLREDQIMVRLQRQFGISAATIRERLGAIRREAAQRESYRIRSANPPASNAAVRPAAPDAIANATDESIPPGVSEEPWDDGDAWRPSYRELQPIECELLELLAAQPDIVSAAIERFPLSQLESPTARAVYQLYIELEQDGHALELPSVMAATEDNDLKSVLASLDEHAQRKAAKATMSPEQRFHSLCERWSRQEELAFHAQQLRELERGEMNEQDQVDLLQSILQQAKIRHGILGTDG